MSKKIGFYAEISLGFSESRAPFVRKKFGKTFNIPTEEEAEGLVKLHRSFIKKTRKIGIPIVSSKVYYEGKCKKSYVYKEIQSCIKSNLQTEIENAIDKETSLILIHKYLEMFKKSWNSNFLVSLDPVVSNFGLEETGTLYYFDFFPPYQRVGKNAFFDWPVPLPENYDFVVGRHFSVKQARVIYSQLMRVLCKKCFVSPDEVKRIVKAHLGKEAYSTIHLPEDTYREKLNDLDPNDADIIRMMACEACYNNTISYTELQEIFSLTHIYPHHPPNIKKFQKAVRVLKKVRTAYYHKDEYQKHSINL